MLPTVPNMAGPCVNAYFTTNSSNAPVINFCPATSNQQLTPVFTATSTGASPITFMQSMPVSCVTSTISMSACPDSVAVPQVSSSMALGGICGGGVLTNQMLPSCSASSAPTFISQHQSLSGVPQQSIIFSGTSGNFFLAQPTPGALGTAVMLAPPNHANPGVSGPNTFVAALAPSGPSGGTVNTAAPAGCFIRFPDGRLIMSPTMGIHRATAPVSQLSPAGVVSQSSATPPTQPTFFPLTMPVVSGSTPTMASNAPLPGQTFFIQMPASAVNLPGGGTLLSPCPTPVSNTFQSQAQQQTNSIGNNTLLKPFPTVLPPSIGGQPTGSPLLSTPLGAAGRSMNTSVDSNTTDLAPPLVGQHGGFLMQQHQQQPLSAVVGQQQQQQIYQQSARPFLVPVSTNSFVDTTIIGHNATSANMELPSGIPFGRLPQGGVAGFTQTSPLAAGANAPLLRPRTSVKPGLGGGGGGHRQQQQTGLVQTQPLPASADEVMRRMDEQIAHLQAISCPTESQASRLRQLIQVRSQLMKAPVDSLRTVTTTTTTTGSTLAGGIPGPVQTGSSAANSPANFRKTSKTLSISSSLRRELMDTLQRHNLSPRTTVQGENTFVVEFRLNQQRYQLRLTRSQKSDMEQLLFTCDAKRQAEILTVFQQEQARLTGRWPRMLLPQQTVTGDSSSATIATVSSAVPPPFQLPNHVSQSIMAQAGMFGAAAQLQQTGSTTFSASPGLRLLAARPLLSTNALVRQSSASNLSAPVAPMSGNSQSSPVVGLVTAVPMPLMAAPGTNGSFLPSGVTATASGLQMGLQGCAGSPSTRIFPLPISSFAPSGQHQQTFVVHTASSLAHSQAAAPMLLSSSSTSASCSVSSSGTPMLPPGCSLLQAPAPQIQQQQTNLDSMSLSVASTNSAVVMPTAAAASRSSLLLTSGGQPVAVSAPPIITMMTVQQAARLARMRAHLSNDIRLSVEKYPSCSGGDGDSTQPMLPQQQPDDDGTGCFPAATRLLDSIGLLKALAPYHVLRDAENTEEALEKVDKILSDSLTILAKRKRQTVDAITALLFKEGLHPLVTSLEDRMLTSYMAFDLERDLLKSEKLAFLDALTSADSESATADQPAPVSVQISTEDTCCIGKAMLAAAQNSGVDGKPDWFGASAFPDSQSPAAQRRARTAYDASATYFKQTGSCLSPPWNTLLGPLASLRPLSVDPSGNTVPNTVQVPRLVSALEPSVVVNGASPAKLPCYDSTLVSESSHWESSDHPPIPVNSASDRPEATVNGGLPQSPSPAASPLLADRTQEDGVQGSANLSSSSSGGQTASNGSHPWRDDYVPFVEETFDIWKEIIKEQGMDMDTIEQDDVLDRELDSMMPNDSASMHPLDNGLSHPGVSEIQHSEDPDIDAAIRSILSSSD